ncbi:MAG: type II toxin-antitoxin system VapC family toxin [Verrucomicrobiales bacterium]|jgi:PIN domain nuclease of toxin-antitoxin system|nr:type II toxin-antitoxin system VapC family toxin [Verrucomicrobiales bacterium]MDP4792772.1 type II toxin-antitoxin system VapC family toxin [Verrucomicrobiales bacterium]MDP4939973.1 type II toxin-antitoxin system VapC family toxin [Verrucomicrobiales bacterium]MDP5005842.1 type II toxin-antitoxin system VapC family toxin [Verrucomicrobiales bacterium]
MRLLLDTHTALWWWGDSPELSETARLSLSDPDAEILFSAISGYEIFQKVRTGKLEVPHALLVDLPGEVRREGWQVLPLGLEETVCAATIKSPHRDPFDRLIAAQSRIHDLTVVTKDPFFADTGFRSLW